MANDSGSAALGDSTLNPSHVDGIGFSPADARLGGNERRRWPALARLRDQAVTRTGEIGKTMLMLDFTGFMATSGIYDSHYLPEYSLILTILLLVGFIFLLSAVALHEIRPEPAATLVLIGAACVVTVIPIIATGAFPNFGFLVWVLVLLLLIAILCIVLVHPDGERVQAIDP